jgi:nicotinamidase-related amidase
MTANGRLEADPEISGFYESTGLMGRVGFGHNPAVLLIDMQVQWNDPNRRLGADMGPALDAIGELVDTARETAVPVVYVWSAWEADGSDAGRWVEKIPALVDIAPGTDGAEIHPRVTPRTGDPLVMKKGPSGFFNTPLDEVLHDLEVDTLLVAGASTSGCVRATTIDCLQYGYRTIVAADVVGDRALAPHEANLLDIDAKYADVTDLAKVLDYMRSLPAPESRREAAEPPRKTPAGNYTLAP